GDALEARWQASTSRPTVRKDAIVEVLGEERPEHHRLRDDEQDDAEPFVGRPFGLQNNLRMGGRPAAERASGSAHGLKVLLAYSWSCTCWPTASLRSLHSRDERGF